MRTMTRRRIGQATLGPRPASSAEALDAMAGLWERHGPDTFAANLRGPTAPALLHALRQGWVWAAGSNAHLTLAGVVALSHHLGRDLIGEWIEAERSAQAPLGRGEAAP